jgi:hypothetical protein
MLTEIRFDTNVPTDKEVVAVSKNGHLLVGILWKTFLGEWQCISNETSLPDVTHFITTENLLKAS